jgi:hypothetical protein
MTQSSNVSARVSSISRTRRRFEDVADSSAQREATGDRHRRFGDSFRERNWKGRRIWTK